MYIYIYLCTIYCIYIYTTHIYIHTIICTSKSSKVKAPQQYDNQGCGQKLPKGSFGPAFNRAGGRYATGGAYAVIFRDEHHKHS